MHCIELAFNDDPRRLAGRPEHRQRLLSLHAQGVVAAAGPWGDDSGALIIVDGDRRTTESLISADPYFELPGVHVIAIRAWSPFIWMQPSPAPRLCQAP